MEQIAASNTTHPESFLQEPTTTGAAGAASSCSAPASSHPRKSATAPTPLNTPYTCGIHPAASRPLSFAASSSTNQPAGAPHNPSIPQTGRYASARNHATSSTLQPPAARNPNMLSLGSAFAASARPFPLKLPTRGEAAQRTSTHQPDHPSRPTQQPTAAPTNHALTSDCHIQDISAHHAYPPHPEGVTTSATASLMSAACRSATTTTTAPNSRRSSTRPSRPAAHPTRSSEGLFSGPMARFQDYKEVAPRSIPAVPAPSKETRPAQGLHPAYGTTPGLPIAGAVPQQHVHPPRASKANRHRSHSPAPLMSPPEPHPTPLFSTPTTNHFPTAFSTPMAISPVMPASMPTPFTPSLPHSHASIAPTTLHASPTPSPTSPSYRSTSASASTTPSAPPPRPRSHHGADTWRAHPIATPYDPPHPCSAAPPAHAATTILLNGSVGQGPLEAGMRHWRGTPNTAAPCNPDTSESLPTPPAHTPSTTPPTSFQPGGTWEFEASLDDTDTEEEEAEGGGAAGDVGAVGVAIGAASEEEMMQALVRQQQELLASHEEALQEAEEVQLALAISMSLAEAGMDPSAVPAPRPRDLRPPPRRPVPVATPQELSYERLVQLQDVRVTTDPDVVLSLAATDVTSVNSTQLGLCSICQVDYCERDEAAHLPCTHTFHRGCIAPWLLEYSRLCPICKADVTNPAGPALPSSPHPQ